MTTYPQEDLIEILFSAIADGRIVPNFQPIVSLNDGDIIGFEVLARWHDDRFGSIPPNVFIPLSEENGLLDRLFDSLLRDALSQAIPWRDDLFLAFNLSPNQVHNPDLPARIARAAEVAGFPLSRIHIEITETATFRDLECAKSIMDRLVDMGCRIVIDDFGTGHASLTWLLNLPVTKIKIDQIFVSSMLTRKESRKIVTAIVGLGRSLELPIVAEGVETRAQAEFLARLGCETVQGFFFGKAVPATDVPGMICGFPRPVSSDVRQHMSLEQRAYQIASLYRWSDLLIGFTDAAGILVDASQSFLRRLGVSSVDAIGKPLASLSSPGLDLDALLPKGVDLLDSRNVVEVTSDSGRTDILIAYDVRDDGGDTLGYSIVGIDITDLRKTQTVLRTQRDQFDFMVENCPHVFWSIAPDGGLVYVHPHWEQISGMPEDYIGTEKVKDFIDPAHWAHVSARWQHSLKTGEVFDMYYRHRLADGRMHWVRCWGVPYRDAAREITAWYGTLSVIDPPRPPDGSPALRFAEVEDAE